MVSHHLDRWREEYRLSHGKESYSLMKQTLHEFFGYWDGKGRRIPGFCEANIIDAEVASSGSIRCFQIPVENSQLRITALNHEPVIWVSGNSSVAFAPEFLRGGYALHLVS